MPISDSVIRKLSPIQRDMLTKHIDGAVQVVRRQGRGQNTLNALIGLGLLRSSTPGLIMRPRATVLTEEGRRVLGVILGEYADALVHAGLLEQEDNPSPLEVLRQLKARHDGGRALQGIVSTRGSSDLPATVTSAVKRHSRQTTE